MSQKLRYSIVLVCLIWLPLAAFAQPGRVSEAPGSICPLLIGSPLPELSVKSLDGKAFDLTASIRSKPTILIYFRGGW